MVKRVLTEEEKSLWQKVTARDKPLRAARHRGTKDFEDELNGLANTDRKKVTPVQNNPMQKKRVAGEKRKQGQGSPVQNGRPQVLPYHGVPLRKNSGNVGECGQGSRNQGSFTRLELRRIRAGVYDIDARLDLHGLRQVQARRKLFSFLRNCQQDGARFALVITGKGGTRQTNRSGNTSHCDDDLRLPWEQDQTEGVLKTMVPMWLAEPDFTRLVVRWSEAHARHGGQGALYIHVRRA